MALSIRFVAEYYNTKTGEVIESKVLRSDEIKKPITIKDLGYLQEEQIALLKEIQDFKLNHETCLLNKTIECPHCEKKTTSHGIRQSKELMSKVVYLSQKISSGLVKLTLF